ncbi:MAG TPA: VTT domain-containing protein [Candidatus Paceibacterota bacterium]|nr:VTT domain-containing protein [Candidatus Paceibacterota bacterium]
MSFNITALIVAIVKTFGYAGIGTIIFAESGLMLGFILPGDSLLFIAGLLASRGFFNIATLVLVVFVTATAGDNIGYAIGRRLGRKVFGRKDSFIFNSDNLQRTEEFFERHGKFTFLVQRFLPVIRAFAPLLAGVGKMRYRTFAAYDFAGTLFWSVGITVLGFYLGAAVPNIDTYLLPIILLIIIVSLIPTFITYKKRKPADGGVKS